MHAQLGAQALPRHDLKDVPGADILDGFGDGGQVLFFGDVWGKRDTPARPVARHARKRPAQLLIEPVDEGLRAAFVGVITDLGGGDQKDTPFEVVEDDERFGLEKEQVGHP